MQTLITNSDTMYLRTPPTYHQAPSKIDREKGIIKDVVLIRTGEAKGHGFEIDDEFIDKVVKLGNEHTPGVKARFGHPNICATALGTYLGRFKNLRKAPFSPSGGDARRAEGAEGAGVIADLYLDKTAIKSPKGDLYTYVLDMAENNPDMFGTSIAFKHGKFKEETFEENGKTKSKRIATIELLRAADIVDEPAATDGLFHADDLAAQVTGFLNQYPQVLDLIEKQPSIIDEFIKHYKSNKMELLEQKLLSLKNWITETFSGKTTADVDLSAVKAEFETKLDELKTGFKQTSKADTEKLNGRITVLESEKSNLLTRADLITGEKQEALNKITALETEIAKLKANPTLKANQVTDPKITLNDKDKDESGKILLSELPSDLRNKLKVTD